MRNKAYFLEELFKLNTAGWPYATNPCLKFGLYKAMQEELTEQECNEIVPFLNVIFSYTRLTAGR